MVTKRVIFFLAVIVFVSSLSYLAIRYARGERLNPETKTLTPTGLLVATSIPNSASVYIDGKLKTATDDTINLLPGNYLVEIKKDGFYSWKKELKVEKELVTKTNTYLFSSFPSLRSLTYTGATNPAIAPDGLKVVFTVATASASKRGLWVLDLANRPFGLNRDPRQIFQSATPGRDLTQSSYYWSPDSKQLLITFKKPTKYKGLINQENFIIDTDKLNNETELIDVTVNLKSFQDQWQKEESLRKNEQLSKLPKRLTEILAGKVDQILFSPDEKKILYTATASATVAQRISPPLPASNSQPENRQLEPGKIYVYDLIEDKNFEIGIKTKLPINQPEKLPTCDSSNICSLNSGTYLTWFPTSNHLFWVQENKVTVLEYDNTNWVDVYSGPFVNGFAFPFPTADKLLILTSLGENSSTNLYAVSLR